MYLIASICIALIKLTTDSAKGSAMQPIYNWRSHQDLIIEKMVTKIYFHILNKKLKETLSKYLNKFEPWSNSANDKEISKWNATIRVKILKEKEKWERIQISVSQRSHLNKLVHYCK